MKKLTLILISILTLLNVNAQTPPIIYVAGDGTGDYNCDGISDQEEINQALDFVASHADYTTVYLKGSHTFLINEPIYISSNTIFEGDSTAVIKLIDNAKWETKFKGLIMQKGATFTISLDDTINVIHDITFRGFEIDGNRQNQEEPSGNSYYNMIKLQNCYNITINNMYMHDNLADIVNITSRHYGNNINLKMFNNRVHGSGHDGVYVYNSINFEIYNNIFTNNRTDAHIRAQHCNHFKIYNNIAGNSTINRNSGGIGIDIQVKPYAPLNDLEIYGNYLYGYGAFHGIWLWQTEKGGELNTYCNVYIHHNIIENSQGAGIGIFGFNNTLIENNVIEHNGEGDNHAYFSHIKKGPQSGITFYEGGYKNKVKGYTTIVRNNIIGNNAGYGLENKKPHLHTFISENNNIYNNVKGHYKNANSTTDIHVYPDYACNDPKTDGNRTSYTANILNPKWTVAEETGEVIGDLGAKEAMLVFHLKSETGRWDGTQWVNDDVTSFCINSGSPSSDCSNEPFPNGNVINIGAYGGTVTASMGENVPDIHGFIAYPNPTTGLLNISEELNNNKYYIYSTTGELIKSGLIINSQIDISNFANGIYIIKVNQYGLSGWKTGKVIKY